MTKEELAATLSGREYTEEITSKESLEAMLSKLIVAFGASDDLLELRGAIDDEVGAYNGATLEITSDLKIMQDDNDIDRVALIKAGWIPPKAAFSINAEWGPEGFDGSWRITSTAPFAAFKIMEGDELYCMGAVIDVSSIST